MNKREVNELKKRLKKEHVSFSGIAGCYVDGNRNKVCTFKEQFLTLSDEEFFKYLEIANKVLSGTMGNNLLNLEFPIDEELPGGHQQFLMGLRESKLDSEELLDSWYDLVISNYEESGNYLILLFTDAYDVMKKTKDDLKLDESEEVFTYILCAVCPVQLSKPGLSYIEEEKRIGSRVRDWIVGVPESGFLFPAFNNRSTDIHAALFYTKDAKEPHREMMEKVLGCGVKATAAQQKNTFHTIVKNVLGPEDDATADKLSEVQQSLSEIRDEYEAAQGEDAEPMVLTGDVIRRALKESSVPEEAAEKITHFTEESFGTEVPFVESVLDRKAVQAGEVIKERQALEEALDEKTREVAELKANAGSAAAHSHDENTEFDVVLKLDESAADDVEIREIGGQAYLMIPVTDQTRISVNGEEL